jgi:hypothetical protein
MKTFLQSITCLAALSLLSSCGSDTSQENNQSQKEIVKPWSLAFETFEATEEACEMPECTFIEITLPILSGGRPSAEEKINAFIDSLYRTNLKMQMPEGMGNVSYDRMCEAFIEGYELFTMEFPDSPQKWEYMMTAESSALLDDYFTMVINTESYLGGAHPNSQTMAATFDLETGNEINPLDGYDEATTMKIAERYFRKYHEIDDLSDLNDRGFMFEDGQFTLPENMALTESGILMIYNSYEVASYAEGGTSFVLPYDSLQKK